MGSIVTERCSLISAVSIGICMLSQSVFSHETQNQNTLKAENQVLEGEFTILLQGAAYAMREHCEIIETTGIVSFNFASDYPVEFDVHHHTETNTLYPVKVSNVTRFSDQFMASDGLEYCFNFISLQAREKKWSFKVSFHVSPLTDASR